jgi:proteasome lid subunit RPN8/RPN11
MLIMAGFFWRLKEFLAAEKRQPNNYIAGNDGRIYCVRDSKLGRLVLRSNRVPTLDTVQEGFQFALPKIPGEMLEVAISFFRAYWNDKEQNEAMVRIVYDTHEEKYLFDCPEQYVTWDHVHAPNVGKDYPEPRYLDVMHIHSHHVLPAEFSSIDDENERKYRLYVVVGNMRAEVPDVKVRVGHGGAYIYLPVDYIFDSPDLAAKQVPYPAEWDHRVNVVI